MLFQKTFDTKSNIIKICIQAYATNIRTTNATINRIPCSKYTNAIFLLSVHSVYTCVHFVYTCVHSVYTCVHSVYTCVHSVFTCVHSVFTYVHRKNSNQQYMTKSIASLKSEIVKSIPHRFLTLIYVLIAPIAIIVLVWLILTFFDIVNPLARYYMGF